MSATRTREVPRPADAPQGATGHLVDAGTGEVLADPTQPDQVAARRAWVMRWRAGHGRRTGGSVRLETYAKGEPPR